MPHRRSLSVQSKLLVSFVLLTIAGITVLTAVGYITARQSLTASAERQLLGLQRSHRDLERVAVTPTMTEGVTRFHLEEFEVQAPKPYAQLVPQSEVAEIAAVGPGEFFGEAGMHGTQSADSRAVAVEDAEVLLLRPDTVRHMFEASPTLARDTGRVLDVRRRAMQSARTALRRH